MTDPGPNESSKAKAMTLRLTAEQAADLETVARVDGMSVADTARADTARAAIASHVARRRENVEFQARLQRVIAENKEALCRLAS